MRNSIFIGLMLGVMILTSCLPDMGDGCANEYYFSNTEFFYRSGYGAPYLTQYIDQTSGYVFCEDVVAPPDSIPGINSIYSVQGIVVEDCNNGDCIKVLSYSNPYCQVEYTKQTTFNYPFLDEWILARYYNRQTTLHPSCNAMDLRWHFDDPDSTTSYTVRANIGLNTLTLVMRPIENNQLVIEGIDHSEELAVPYVKYFEDRLINYLEDQDTLTYVVEGNEMKLFSSDTQDGLVFYQLGL